MKRLLPIFMACLAMLTANAEDYKLSFGALSVNSDNYTQLNELLTAEGVLQSGTVEYLPQQNKVVLDNAYLYLENETYEDVIASENIEVPLVIEVKGECTLQSERFDLGYTLINVSVSGKDKRGDLIIEGTSADKLNLIGGVSGVLSKNLKVSDITIDANCYDMIFNSHCFLDKATVIVRQSIHMISNTPISFSEGWGFVYPEDGSHETSSPEYNKTFLTNPSPITAVIRSLDQPIESYDLYIQGVQITELNCEGLLWDKRLDYDPSTKTLNLWGVLLQGESTDTGEGAEKFACIYSNISGLTIKANGNNRLSYFGKKRANIYLCKTTNIVGNGKLHCYSADYGIYMDGLGTLTIGGNVELTADGKISGLQARSRWNVSTSELQYYATLCIKDKARVSAKGQTNGAIYDWKDLLLENKHSITHPNGAQWSSNSVCGKDGLPVCDEWVIIDAPDIKGDVNNDGLVNTTDIVAIYSYIEQGDASGFSRKRANVDGDDDVNTADVVAVYNIIILGDTE